jgi:two-component system KDP operon response regulator KdpE
VALRHAATLRTAERVYRNGPLECDLEGKTVKLDGILVRLTGTEFDILRVLIQNSGKVVTHRALLKEIWGPNAVEHTQYLRVYVGQLRKKLLAIAPRITTEPGIGYRLIDAE